MSEAFSYVGFAVLMILILFSAVGMLLNTISPKEDIKKWELRGLYFVGFVFMVDIMIDLWKAFFGG